MIERFDIHVNVGRGHVADINQSEAIQVACGSAVFPERPALHADVGPMRLLENLPSRLRGMFGGAPQQQRNHDVGQRRQRRHPDGDTCRIKPPVDNECWHFSFTKARAAGYLRDCASSTAQYTPPAWLGRGEFSTSTDASEGEPLGCKRK